MLVFLLQFFLLLTFSTPCHSREIKQNIFNNIETIHQFADEHDEYPPITNNNWKEPDYSAFQKKMAPTVFSRIMRWFGLTKPLWDAYEFQKLLSRVTNERELNGLMNQFVQKFIPVKDDNCIIFGNLEGAFHSLVRGLDEFIRKKYLDNSLRIINPQVYIVFNGDVVDKSAYILETLTVILVLMHKNPDHVFYLRGPLEYKRHWITGCLPKELSFKAGYASNEDIPFLSLMNRFFNTLPLAFYLLDNSSQQTKEIIRIAPWAKDFSILNEESFSAFFSDNKTGLSTLKLTGNQLKKNTVTIKALIMNELLDIGYQKTIGLQVASKEKGLTTWTLLSSPIGPNRQLYDFYYDAFAILSTKNSINSWTIQLCNRDVRDFRGFICGQKFNVITGFEEREEKEVKPEICTEAATLKQQLTQTQTELEQLKKQMIVPQKFKVSPEKVIPQVAPQAQPAAGKPKPVIAKIPIPEQITLATTRDLSKTIREEGHDSLSGMNLFLMN